MKHWIIYKHTLLADCEHKGWSYIGQTCKVDIKDRWRNGNGYRNSHGKIFYRAIQKYGWDNFSHEIIEDNIETQEKANEREIYWISFYHTWIKDPNCQGYNMSPGGNQWGNGDYKWYTNGIEEKMLLDTIDTIPDGWKLGRLPMSVEQRDKLRAAAITLKAGERLGYNNKGKIKVYKDEIEKNILPEQLEEYLAAGWLRGISKKNLSSRYKKIQCIETGEIFESLQAATNKYGSHVIDVLHGTRNHTHNLHFKYYEEI